MEIKGIYSGYHRNEDGYIMISSLMVLTLVTIIGAMSIRTSNSDLESSTNDQFYNMSFYAAEAARAFVYYNPALYGSDNVTLAALVRFPDSAHPAIAKQIITGGTEAFMGSVEYVGPSVPYRGSGFAVGKFKAHNYRMICEGHAQYNSPRDSTTRIESGFYRMGF